MKRILINISLGTLLLALVRVPVTYAAPRVGNNIVSSNGVVYTVTSSNEKRPYTSEGAFLSYGFNSFSRVVKENADEAVLTVGSFVPPQDGTIICSDRGSDKGTCYLITDSKKAGFVSEAVFRSYGFSFNQALYGDVSWLASTSNIDSANNKHPNGVLVKNTGTVYLVQSDGLWGIPDMRTFNSWGLSFSKVVDANTWDNSLAVSGILAVRTPGQLGYIKRGAGSTSTNGWQLTVYYTPVEDYYTGNLVPVYGCLTPAQSNCSNYLGDHKSGFVNVAKIEGAAKLTTGTYAGKYIGYSPEKGFWLEDAPLGADGKALVPFSSSAADASIALGTGFKILDCGKEDSGASVDPSFCEKLKSSNWVVTDRFAASNVGKHFDLYIGEENSAGFKTSNWIIDSKNAVVQIN